MSSIQPITRIKHGTKRWHRPPNYLYAASVAVMPVAASEVMQACAELPLAFMPAGEGWALVAVLGLAPGQNLFVNEAGAWDAGYIPARIRAYPFQLGQDATNNSVLCIDDANGLVDDGPDGEAFFDDAGDASEPVKQVHALLTNAARSELALAKACRVLHAAGVIAPWPIVVQEAGSERKVTGLHRIDEAALDALDDTAFGQLRQAGVVGLAYAQLLSIGKLAALGRLAQARAHAVARAHARAQPKPMVMLPLDSNIDWDWSKVGKR